MNDIKEASVAVIIPTFKAHKTIKKTLCSLATQFGVTYTVYLVVDGEEDGTYDYLKDMFGNILDIEILYKPTNTGPGLSRQYAIEHTNEPFITFIDSDDVLFNTNALVTMKNNFEPEDVVIITPFYQEMDDGSFRLRGSSCLTWMHGKMYRRSFLDKYKIHFNNDFSYSNEDAGFNSMVGLIADSVTERIKLLDLNHLTYIQLKNPNSITNANNREFSRTRLNVEGFVHNKLHAFDYTINTLNIFDKGIAEAAVRSMCHIYINYYDINRDVDGYAELVDELARKAYKQLSDYFINELTEEKIQEIEKDLLIDCGCSFKAYRDWLENIIG